MVGTRRTFLKGVGLSVGSLAGAGSIPPVQAQAGKSVEADEDTVLGTIVTLYDAIPDQQRERFAGVWNLSQHIIDTANEILALVTGVDTVADLGKYAGSIMGILRNITQNIAQAYGFEIKTRYLDAAVRATGYLPLLVQIWDVIEASQHVLDTAPDKSTFLEKIQLSETMEAAVERFYIAILLLLTEIALAASGVGYATAFGSTRRVANVGLVHLRRTIGLRAYSVLLSVVHWLVRGGTEETITFVVERTATLAQEVDSAHFRKLTKTEIQQALPLPNTDIRTELSQSLSQWGTYMDSITGSGLPSEFRDSLLSRYNGAGIIDIVAANSEDDSSGWWPFKVSTR